jgi:hypothetical protein
MLDVATAPESCGDGHELVATAVGNQKGRLNRGADVPIVELARLIREELRYHSMKHVYIAAESQVSWGEFMMLVDHLWPDSEVISILTPNVEALAVQRVCLAPSCGECLRLRSLRK